MGNKEFSDSFDTLLNSYASQGVFGEEYNKNDIVLDEYEKSVLLTQAQDIIVKSYFDRNLNSQGQGFDDSTRRQVDFSSLIRIATISTSSISDRFDDRGRIFKLPAWKNQEGTIVPNTSEVLFILNEKLIVGGGSQSAGLWYKSGKISVTAAESDTVARSLEYCANATEAEQWSWRCEYMEGFGYVWSREGFTPITKSTDAFPAGELSKYADVEQAKSDGWYYQQGSSSSSSKEYVVVPINYREYDREMSKAYAQPLKKQAWRIFHNDGTGYDINSEIITKFDVAESADMTYKVRYVKRPRPIVLVTLPPNLEVDGYTDESTCELHPILHPDILQKAVEIAVATRGGRTQRAEGNQ